MKQGWLIKNLMEVANVSTGKWDANHSTENGKYRFYTCAYDYLYCDTNRFSGECLILPGNGVNVGEVFYYEGEFDAYQRTYVLSDIKLLPKYLYYHMLLFWKELGTKLQYGSATNFIKIGNFKDYEVQYPPLPEQQHIVSILDEAFAAIAKTKANAEQNLKNAKELFESYLQGVFENGNWETKTIQEITKIINGYAFASKDFKSTNTIKSIKITNVGVKEFVEEVDNYLPEKFKDILKEVQVKEGNIVIALTRTIISSGLKVAVVPESYDGALVNQRVAAIVPNEIIINQKYLYNFLTTDGVAKYVLAHVNTLMQPNLSINDLKNLPVPCPSLKTQQTIVQKLDALSAETKKLESIYQQKINDLEELKKSVLQKAFSGELNSPERALSANDGHSPSDKNKNKKSPERA